MRRAFTLIELLVIIGIMGAMVTVSIVNVRAGQGAARTRGATRDIYAVIRHARSTALVTQQPAVITYSTVEEDGEVMAKIEVTSTKVLDSTLDMGEVQTLTGAPVGADGDYHAAMREMSRKSSRREKGAARAKRTATAPTTAGETAGETAATASSDGGSSVEDVLFAPVSTDVVKGMRLKVLMGTEELATSTTDAKPKISVFSNVDYILGKFNANKAKSESADASNAAATKSVSASANEGQEPVSVVWEVNGRVEPHRVWVYPDGSTPEKGLCIRIDRFGAAKVVSEGEEE